MRKIEWAPLNVPLRRRLETLSACGWMCLFLFGELWMLLYYFYLLVRTKLLNIYKESIEPFFFSDIRRTLRQNLLPHLWNLHLHRPKSRS